MAYKKVDGKEVLEVAVVEGPPVVITGVATEEKQEEQIVIAEDQLVEEELQTAALQDIEAGTPESLGQKTMAASMPVVLASDQTTVPVNISGSSFLPTQVDIPTSANQVLSSPLANRKSLLVANMDSANRIFVGTSSGVTITDGFVVEPKSTFEFPFGAGVTSIYMIAQTATVRVGLMEIT